MNLREFLFIIDPAYEVIERQDTERYLVAKIMDKQSLKLLWAWQAISDIVKTDTFVQSKRPEYFNHGDCMGLIQIQDGIIADEYFIKKAIEL